jgi:hypothetical protein
MSAAIIHDLYAGLAPWLALALILLGRNPHLSRTRIIGSLLLAFFLLRIPIEGWHLFAWVRVLEPNPSFTLTALLGVALAQRLSGRNIFHSADWRAAWLVGAVLALLLYPMGLGLTSIDPYGWGWGPVLTIVIAVVGALLILMGNRFGIVLLFPFLGSLLHLQESTNFWDAVIDPFYGGVALVTTLVTLFPRRKKSPFRV